MIILANSLTDSTYQTRYPLGSSQDISGVGGKIILPVPKGVDPRNRVFSTWNPVESLKDALGYNNTISLISSKGAGSSGYNVAGTYTLPSFSFLYPRGIFLGNKKVTGISPVSYSMHSDTISLNLSNKNVRMFSIVVATGLLDRDAPAINPPGTLLSPVDPSLLQVQYQETGKGGAGIPGSLTVASWSQPHCDPYVFVSKPVIYDDPTPNMTDLQVKIGLNTPNSYLSTYPNSSRLEVFYVGILYNE